MTPRGLKRSNPPRPRNLGVPASGSPGWDPVLDTLIESATKMQSKPNFLQSSNQNQFCKLQLFCNSVALDSSGPFCAPTGLSYYSISILCIEYWLDYWAGRRKWREKEREVFFLTMVCFICISSISSWISYYRKVASTCSSCLEAGFYWLSMKGKFDV